MTAALTVRNDLAAYQRSDAANEPGHTLHSTVFLVESDADPVASAEIAEVRWTPMSDHPDDLAPMLEHHVLPRLVEMFTKG